ncbi:hypothetical protein [Candidatus Nitrosotenuis cloacae]|nr:hypothetical protein [Candidatus Nitrosotenuis cloacae]
MVHQTAKGQLLDKYSKFVKKIEDIPRVYQELESKVEVKDEGNLAV